VQAERSDGLALDHDEHTQIEQDMIQDRTEPGHLPVHESSVCESGKIRNQIPGFLRVLDHEILEGFVNTDLGSRIVPMPRLDATRGRSITRCSAPILRSPFQ
jgi:hypothetical protein